MDLLYPCHQEKTLKALLSDAHLSLQANGVPDFLISTHKAKCGIPLVKFAHPLTGNTQNSISEPISAADLYLPMFLIKELFIFALKRSFV